MPAGKQCYFLNVALVVLMRHFEKLSNQEVAAALGLSGPAASMR